MSKLRDLFRALAKVNALIPLSSTGVQEKLRIINEKPLEERCSALLSFPIERIPTFEIAGMLISSLEQVDKERKRQQRQTLDEQWPKTKVHRILRALNKEYCKRNPKTQTPVALQSLLLKYKPSLDEKQQKEIEAFVATSMVLMEKLLEAKRWSVELQPRQGSQSNLSSHSINPADETLARLDEIDRQDKLLTEGSVTSLLQEVCKVLPFDDFEVVRQLFEGGYREPGIL
jgi:hypothetical protein